MATPKNGENDETALGLDAVAVGATIAAAIAAIASSGTTGAAVARSITRARRALNHTSDAVAVGAIVVDELATGAVGTTVVEELALVAVAV